MAWFTLIHSPCGALGKLMAPRLHRNHCIYAYFLMDTQNSRQFRENNGAGDIAYTPAITLSTTSRPFNYAQSQISQSKINQF